MQRLIVVLSLALSLPASGVAQRPSTDSAAVAGRASLWAMAHSDFQYVARHTSPYELRQLRLDFDSLLRADTVNYIAMRLFRMDSTSQVRRLSDTDFAGALMTFAFGINPSFRQLATIVDIDVPGSVRRGPDTSFVVYRWVYPRDSLQTAFYNVQRMVRCGGDWCAQSPGNLKGILDLLKQPMVPAGVVRATKP
jgi:hypothetical protein